jgi:DNA-binding NtrC family response regulator
MSSRILFVSEHQGDARRLTEMLHSLPVVLDHVSTMRQTRVRLRQSDYKVILTEASLPDGNWLDVLRAAHNQKATEVIVTDAHADARLWSEALNLGAYDLVSQPFYEPEVRRILYNACSRSSELNVERQSRELAAG